MRFEVVAGDVVIGWSDLEHGDPPTGVAHGRMHVTAAYSPERLDESLRVRPQGGEFFVLERGIHVDDFSADLGPEGIEVHVLGIDAATYARFFEHHVRDYVERST